MSDDDRDLDIDSDEEGFGGSGGGGGGQDKRAHHNALVILFRSSHNVTKLLTYTNTITTYQDNEAHHNASVIFSLLLCENTNFRPVPSRLVFPIQECPISSQ